VQEPAAIMIEARSRRTPVNTSLRITCLGLPIDVDLMPTDLEVVIPPPKDMERRPAAGMTLRGEYAQVLEALAQMGAAWDASGGEPRITVKVVVERQPSLVTAQAW
jgi:hypothetical protein